MSHSTQISVDLRGFHIFDDDGDESSEGDSNSEKAKKKQTLKNRIKHAKKMSVDLSGYHIFGTNESSSEEEEEEEEEVKKQKPKPKPKHSKKISIDLQGFDLFYDSDSEEEESEDDEAMDFKPKPPAELAPNKETISASAENNFKKAQKLYLQNDDDEDLKGFHLFDEYNSDDDEEEEDVIKLHKMEKDQLAVLVRSLLVENAILKDASQRARGKLDAKKARLKHAEESKKTLLKAVAKEMDSMRQIIYEQASRLNSSGQQRSATTG